LQPFLQVGNFSGCWSCGRGLGPSIRERSAGAAAFAVWPLNAVYQAKSRFQQRFHEEFDGLAEGL
jgi:hypothetical protein